MSDHKNPTGVLAALLLAAAAAGVLAYRRRPIKPPTSAGSWEPVESQRTQRK